MKINLSISKRLILSFVIMVLMVFLAIGVGVWYTFQISTAVTATSTGVKQVSQLAELQFVWTEVASTVDNLFLSRQSGLIETQLQDQIDEFARQLDKLNHQPPGLSPEAMAANEQIVREMNWLGNNLIKLTADIIELIKADHWPQAQALRYAEMASFQRRFDTELGKLNNNTQTEIDQLAVQVAQAQRASLVYWAITAVIALVTAFLSGWLAIRSITRPVHSLIQQAERVARRDFRPVSPLQQQDEIGDLSRALALTTDWLRDSYESLEQRVAQRTQRLEVVAALSEQLNVILDVSELLQEAVNLIQSHFNYYHAHIYLINERRNRLVVAAGTGPAGAEMKAKAHSISIDANSLVARAARNHQLVRADNVRYMSDWLPNPLLPDTQSEMAVPIIIDGQVAGVLDVQQDSVAGLDDADANLLRSLASQVAVAIRNARLFEQVEHALQEAYQAQERYTEQAWERSKLEALGGSYLYTTPAEAGDAAAISKIDVADGPKIVSTNADETPQQILAAPINLRDQIIGQLQLGAGQNKQPWTNDDLSMLATIVDQFAQTADNLRLFEETRARAGREQTIREITDKLRAAPNIDFLLEIAARELGARLGVQRARLKLGIGQDPDSKLNDASQDFSLS